jgi:xylulokinase
MTPCILAVDSGSTAVKAAVVDIDGKIRGTAIAQIETILGDGGCAEQSPHQLWGAVLEACQTALDVSKGDDCHIIGVACSSQYSSLIPVGTDGEASGNLLLWRDTRGARHVRALLDAQSGAEKTWARIHGLAPFRDGRDTLAHMLHIKHDDPTLYEKTKVFLEPADFLSLKFSGIVSATPCSVFKMLLTDNRGSQSQSFDDELVALSGIDPEKLPPMVAPGTVLGPVLPELAEALSIPAGTMVVCSMNDNHAVALSTAALEPATAGLSIGTTANVSALIDGMKSDGRRRISSMPTPLQGRNMVMAENGWGGKVLEVALNQVLHAGNGRTPEQRFADLEAAACRSAPGSGGVLFLPWLNGAGSPGCNSQARAGFLNISPNTTHDDMMRSLLEGIVFNLRWLSDAVEDVAETRFDRLMFTGGVALSDTCAQIMADVFERPVHQMENQRYAPCRGLAFFAFCRLGALNENDNSAFSRIGRTFEPDPNNRALYTEHFSQMLEAFDATVPIASALNHPNHGD